MISLKKLECVTDELLNFLKSDPVQTLNIIGILENSALETLDIRVDSCEKPTGVLVRKGYFCYVYSKCTVFLESLVNGYFVDDFYGFSGLSNFVASYLEPYFNLQWKEVCHIYYLPFGGLKTELKKRPIKTIPIEYAKEIDSYYTYKDAHSIYKIQDRLMTMSSSGYFEGDELYSWALVHDDNSLGVMYTKDAFRGKGLAVDVTIDLCMKEIKRGKQPFVQISTENTMSPGLALKCGFLAYNPDKPSELSTGGDAIWFGGYWGLPKAFKAVGQALGICVTQMISLYSLPIRDDFTRIKVCERGSERQINVPCTIKESANSERQFEILNGGHSLGFIWCIVHDDYWCYIKEVDDSLKEWTVFVSFLGFLKDNNMEIVLFKGIKLPEKYAVVEF
jgi:hypothetical protein